MRLPSHRTYSRVMSEMTADQKQPRAPVALSVLSMLFASAVAIGTGLYYQGVDIFCMSEQFRGANIENGGVVALLSGLVGSVLILCVRKRRRLLAAVLLLGAATLSVTIAFVALDSASYVARRDCGMFSSQITTFNDHVEYLYVLWGMPLGFLLWAAVMPWMKPRLRAHATV